MADPQHDAHDRQPYPTQDAYDAVCRALRHHREQADSDRQRAERAEWAAAEQACVIDALGHVGRAAIATTGSLEDGVRAEPAAERDHADAVMEHVVGPLIRERDEARHDARWAHGERARLLHGVDERDAELAELRQRAERARHGEQDARLLLAGLVAASKATLAAFADGDPEAARAILGHELYAHGWDPAPGSHAPQILADAATAFHDAGLDAAA